MALYLWDSSGSNITEDITTLASTGFTAGEHIVSGDFNRILRETSLITSVFAEYIKTKTSNEISYNTSVANVTTWLTNALLPSVSTISGGQKGQLLYQQAASSTAFITNATANGALLKFNTTTGIPYWDNTCKADDSDKVDGWHITTDSIPTTPDPNTIYLQRVTS